MLDLTGRVGDGWLPSMSYVPVDTLEERNARIDEGAAKAGREPAMIRRLYNVAPGAEGRTGLVGQPSDWPEQLAELTLTHGMSTFILATDDPRLIQVFGTEVAPATRDLVEAARLVGAAPVEVPREQERVEVRLGGQPVVATQDDGVRRSDRKLIDEAERPAYTNRLTPLAWTDHERAGAQHLIDVHDHLRQEMAQLHSIVDQVGAGTVDVASARNLINTMTMRQNNWTLGVYCESYCRLVTTHHTLEDVALFPRLSQSEPGLAPVVERLELEHHAIAGVLEELDQALVALVAGNGDLPALREAMDLLDDTLLSHLAWEESMLLEPIARYGVL